MEDKITHIISKLQKTYNIPAVTVGYIKNDDSISFSLGDKIMEMHARRPRENIPSNETLFGIGSLSKGFTAIAIAIALQNNSSLSLDTPLIEIFGPEIQFIDNHRTQNACLRDILSHKMGVELGETDFGYIMGNIDRNALVRKLKFLPFAAEFRTKLVYNNFMYTVAGVACEKISGKSFENFLKENIFDLLGMEDTTFLDEVDIKTSNLAMPHIGIEKTSSPIDFNVHRQSGSVAPAASICSSSRDMLKWMRFLLNRGEIGGVPIVKRHIFEECFKPQFALPVGKSEWDGYVSKPVFPVTETRDTYGFGWYLGTYRGYRTYAHSGELFGYDCLMTLFPDMNIGIYTNMNGPGGETAYIVNQLLHYYIADLLLGFEPWLNEETIQSFPEPWKSREEYFIPRVRSVIEKSIPFMRSLGEYTGRYKHGFLGDIAISEKNEKLHFTMGEIGHFILYPNGEKDEFRMEGIKALDFIHLWDLYQPSDWMTVKFNFTLSNDTYCASSLSCSLFESGPVFVKS